MPEPTAPMTPQTPPQGMAEPPRHHSHMGLWVLIIILILVITGLVALTLVMFSERNEEADIVLDDRDPAPLDDDMMTDEDEEIEDEERAEMLTPHIYRVGDDFWMIDPVTGEESLAYAAEPGLSLFAVPQQNFDGRFFLTFQLVDAGGGPRIPLLVTIGSSEAPQPVSFASELPSATDALVASPSGVHVAAAYDNPAFDETSKEVLGWNLLTGSSQVMGSVSEDEYLAARVGYNTYGGAILHDIIWTSSKCVQVGVYQDDPEQLVEGGNPETKIFKEHREYCLE